MRNRMFLPLLLHASSLSTITYRSYIDTIDFERQTARVLACECRTYGQYWLFAHVRCANLSEQQIDNTVILAVWGNSTEGRE